MLTIILDKAGDFLVQILIYLFEQNGPYTIIMIIFGILLYLMWRQYGKAEKWRRKKELSDDIFEAQMQHYDDSVNELSNLLKSNFMRLRKQTLLNKEVELKQAQEDRQLTHDEYHEIEAKIKQTLSSDGEVHRFNLMIENIENRITPLFRRIYKANHLAEKSPTQFEEHITDRVNHILSKFTEELNDKYWDGTEPDRTTLYDSQQLLVPRAENMIKDILRHARDIAVEYINNKELKREHFLRELV